MTAASFALVQPMLDVLLAGLEQSLRGRLVGVYLYGSFVCGDFDPAISDLDLAVVLADDLDQSGFDSLDRLHRAVLREFSSWHNRLELAYVSRAALATFRVHASRIAIISPGEPFHFTQAGRDWLISWHPLRESGLALRGPPIQGLIAPISPEEYIAEVRAHIKNYPAQVKTARDKSFLSYIVLTVARGRYTVEHGRAASKIQAAQWARRQHPRWATLLNMAIQWRADPRSDGLSEEDIRPRVAAYVADMLAGL